MNAYELGLSIGLRKQAVDPTYPELPTAGAILGAGGGALLGAGVGAGAGALLGEKNKRLRAAVIGALLGGGTGGVLGGMVGRFAGGLPEQMKRHEIANRQRQTRAKWGDALGKEIERRELLMSGLEPQGQVR